MKSLDYLNEIQSFIVILSNIVIGYRLVLYCVNIMHDNDATQHKKRVFNCILAGILINVVSGMILVAKKYYGG